MHTPDMNNENEQNNERGKHYKIHKSYIQKYRQTEKGRKKTNETNKRYFDSLREYKNKYNQIQKIVS